MPSKFFSNEDVMEVRNDGAQWCILLDSRETPIMLPGHEVLGRAVKAANRNYFLHLEILQDRWKILTIPNLDCSCNRLRIYRYLLVYCVVLKI